MKTNIKDHSEVMSLLGKKLGLMENINYLQDEIKKIDEELHLIEKGKIFHKIKGEDDE
tara:strand:- start:434 stop:607 length:174 start_codon:yes stop_codon:yes gene_type:complete